VDRRRARQFPGVTSHRRGEDSASRSDAMLHAAEKFAQGGYMWPAVFTASRSRSSTPLSESTDHDRQTRRQRVSFEPASRRRTQGRPGQAEGSGTRQWFMPDTEMFEVTQFHWTSSRNALRELAFLKPGAFDHDCATSAATSRASGTTSSDGGIVSFVEWLNEKKDAPPSNHQTNSERDGVDVEVAMQYTDTYSDQIFS